MHTKRVSASLAVSGTALAIGVILIKSVHSSPSISKVPSLVGSWDVRSEGAMIVHGKDLSAKSHHIDQFTSLNATAIIEKQQGRRVIGIFKSPRYTERFAGVITPDGTGLAYVDEDGSLDGRIINGNHIEVIYRHMSKTESVVAVGTWSRSQKSQ